MGDLCVHSVLDKGVRSAGITALWAPFLFAGLILVVRERIDYDD